MSDSTVEVTEFSDPGCPFAFSAEPARQRLRWLFGDQLSWRLVMVGLSDSPDDYLNKGLDAELLAEGAAQIADRYGMPIYTEVKERVHATAPSCRAIVAAELFAPQTGRALMRALQEAVFGSEALLDQPQTIAAAARRAGLDPDELAGWMETDRVRERFEAQRAEARSPRPVALALDHKLAGWEGGRRYTCPSFRFTRRDSGASLEAPGFHPASTYEVLLANLAPELERTEQSDDVEAVLSWAGSRLATQEVATVCDIDREEARRRLVEAGAVEQPSGTDSYWEPAST